MSQILFTQFKWAHELSQTCFNASGHMFFNHVLSFPYRAYVSQTWFNSNGHIFLNHVSIQVGINFSQSSGHILLLHVSIQMGIYCFHMFQFKWAYIAFTCINASGHMFFNHVLSLLYRWLGGGQNLLLTPIHRQRIQT